MNHIYGKIINETQSIMNYKQKRIVEFNKTVTYTRFLKKLHNAEF